VGLAKKSAGTFISQTITQLIQFFIGVMTARYLGPEGKGLIYVLIISLAMALTLGNLGLGQASIYFIGKNRKRLPATVSNLLIATGVISLVLGAVGWLWLQYRRPDIYAQFPLWVWTGMALLIPIYLLQSFFMQVLSAILRIYEINIVDLTRVATQLFLFVLFVIVMRQGINGAFLAYALSAFLAAGAFVSLVLYHGGYPQRPDWQLFGSSLRFGTKAYLSDCLRMLTARLDVLLVASLASGGIPAVGVYSVATSLAEILLSIPIAIRLSLFPMVAATNAAEANRLTSTACRHTMFITLVAALGFIVSGPFLIRSSYGEAFGGAATALLILLPGTMALSQSMLFCSALEGRGRPGVSSLCRAASLPIIVMLDLLLIPPYGITGAAIASTCAYTAEFVLAGSIFIHYADMPWEKILVFRWSDFFHYVDFLRHSLPLRKTTYL
jgi:O-antigen/teichoic acid export membrane protein